MKWLYSHFDTMICFIQYRNSIGFDQVSGQNNSILLSLTWEILTEQSLMLRSRQTQLIKFFSGNKLRLAGVLDRYEYPPFGQSFNCFSSPISSWENNMEGHSCKRSINMNLNLCCGASGLQWRVVTCSARCLKRGIEAFGMDDYFFFLRWYGHGSYIDQIGWRSADSSNRDFIQYVTAIAARGKNIKPMAYKGTHIFSMAGISISFDGIERIFSKMWLIWKG